MRIGKMQRVATLHSDHTVTYWSTCQKAWMKHVSVSSIPEKDLASMTERERKRILNWWPKKEKTNRTITNKFWMVFGGNCVSNSRFPSFEAAKSEAEQLCKQHKCNYYILEYVGKVELVDSPVVRYTAVVNPLFKYEDPK